MKVMRRPLPGASLRRGTMWYGTTTLLERLVGFAALPILTKNFAQSAFGLWTQTLVSASLFSTLVCMGFATAEVRYLAGQENPRETSGVFHWMLAGVFGMSVLLMAAVIMFGGGVSALLFGDPQFVGFARLFGLLVVTESLLELLTAFLRARGQVPRLSGYLLLKSLTRIGVLATGAYLIRMEITEMIVAIVALQGLFALYLYRKHVLCTVGFSYSLRDLPWRKVLSFSLALLPYELLVGFQMTVNRYLIVNLIGLEGVGVYAAAWALAGTVGLVYAVLGFTVYPHMARLWNQSDKAGAADTLSAALRYFMFAAAPLVVILTVLYAPLTRVLTTADYVASWRLVLWLCLAVGAFGIYQLCFYATLLTNNAKANFRALMVSLATVGVLSLVLTPAFGVVGSAASLFAANAVLAAETFRIARKVVAFEFPWRLLARITAACTATALTLSVAQLAFNPFHLIVLIGLVGLGGFVYAGLDLLSKDSVIRRFGWAN